MLKLQRQKQSVDAQKNLNAYNTDRIIIRSSKNTNSAYKTPTNEKKSWGAGSTKGKSTEQSSAELGRSSACEILSQEVQQKGCSNAISVDL